MYNFEDRYFISSIHYKIFEKLKLFSFEIKLQQIKTKTNK